jgi:hypothetical protein
LRLFFIFESSIYIADEMISNIIADVHLFYFTVLAELGIEVFVKGVIVLLDLLSVECVSGVVDWVLVDVSTENGLTELRTYMFSTTSIAVSACANFVVERTIYFVLFSAWKVSKSFGGKGHIP